MLHNVLEFVVTVRTLISPSVFTLSYQRPASCSFTKATSQCTKVNRKEL